MDVFSKETFSWLEQMLICYLSHYHAEEKLTLTTFLLKENPQKHDEQFSATWWRWHVDDPKAPMGHSEGISSVVEIWSKRIRKGLMNTFTFMTWKRQRSPVCVWWKRCGKAMFKMRIFLPLLVVTNPWWILDLDWFNGLRKAGRTKTCCQNSGQCNIMWYRDNLRSPDARSQGRVHLRPGGAQIDFRPLPWHLMLIGTKYSDCGDFGDFWHAIPCGRLWFLLISEDVWWSPWIKWYIMMALRYSWNLCSQCLIGSKQI